MKEKRDMKTAMNNRKKELLELEAKTVNDNAIRHKKERKAKKIGISESDKKLDALKQKEKENNSLEKFNKLKMGALSSIKTSKELNDFEKIMGGVSNDMARNPEKLYEYLGQYAKEDSEKKSNVSLKISDE